MNTVTAPYRSVRPLRGCRCHAPQQMNGLGLSLLSKFLKISQPGPNEFKLQTTPNVVKKAIAVAGPVLSVFGPWGKVAAAGAAVITAADQRQKQQKLQDAARSGNAQALIAAYKDLAGQVPGRAIGLQNLQALIDAFGKTGGWPNVKKWNTASATDIFNGCRGCTPPWIPDFVRAQISGGVTDPFAMVPAWDQHVNQTWGSKWFVSSAGQLQGQLIADIFDYEVSQLAPNAPQVYGMPAPDQPAPTPVPIAAAPGLPVLAPPVTQTPAPTIQPVKPLPNSRPTTLPATPTTPAITVNVPPNVAPDQTAALIQQLMAQGASQQQALTAAIASLQAQGVNTATPQVQQQLASDVASASQPQQASVGLLALGAAAVIGFGILMSRRKGH